MIIKSIKIINYKSFSESKEIIFHKGYNIIVGTNNTGKSSLLEVLKLDFKSCPHLSEETKPNILLKADPNSIIEVEIETSIDDIYDFYLRNNKKKLYFPFFKKHNAEINKKIYEKFFNENSLLLFKFKILNNEVIDAEIKNSPFNTLKNDIAFLCRIKNNPFQLIEIKGGIEGNLYNQLFYYMLFKEFREKYVYYFHAERYKVGRSNIGPNIILKSDASNLPEVIDNLKSNPQKFKRFNKIINVIFPEIKRITTVNRSHNFVEIRLWSFDPKTEREDLTISLDDSGTGIGQVLALLYVVTCSDINRTIIIDEPQSFLHPGAIRKLFKILNQHLEHQYIFATHSPTVINSAKNSSMILLEKKNYETIIQEIDSLDMENIKRVLKTIGVSISDIFGADYIIWVEGPTEEKAFSLLFEKLISPYEFSSIQICAVQQTGDLNGKKAKLVFEIYEKLSGGNRIIPPAICFIFDSENKTEKIKKDIKKNSKQDVFFLNRRMFENYILHKKAILSILKKRAQEFKIEGIKITDKIILDWFISKFNKNKYYQHMGIKSIELKYNDDIWYTKIHAAQFLNDIFYELLDEKYVYDKVIDSVDLVKWILENDIPFIKELNEELKQTILKLQQMHK